VRRAAFHAVGGFTEDHGVTHEDWEFFAEAALAGLRFEIVPEALFWYRVGENSMIRTTDAYRNHMRHIRPFKKRMPPQLAGLVPFSQAQQLWRGQLLNAITGYHLNLQQALKAWIDSARKLSEAGRLDEAGAVLTEALDLATRTGQPEILVEALISAGAVAIRLEAVEQARRYFEDALARAREARYEAGTTRVRTVLAQLDRLAALTPGAAEPSRR
jgi:GT2 family glycosyltransferase